MDNPEKRKEQRCCRWCAGIRAGGLASDGREAKDRVLREGMGCRGRGILDWEKYLQIPTYMRWGRRLSAK
jgi:hypothetical protein